MTTEKKAVKIVKKILNYYKVPVTGTRIKEFLLTHPDFPDLVSISDAFDEWNINHAAVKVGVEQLPLIETPFIAGMKDFEESIVIIREVEDDLIIYETSTKTAVNTDIFNFSKNWSGCVIALSPNEQSGEDDYDSELKTQRYNNYKHGFLCLLSIAIFVLLIKIRFSSINNTSFYLIFGQSILSSIGVILSALLYSYEQGVTPSFVEELCRSQDSFSCQEILQSKGSKLFGLVSWSKIGLVNFGGILILLLIPLSNFNNILSVTSLINICTLPYTFYSIYYQGIVIKKWCVLCLSVQLLIWLQFLFYQSFDIIHPLNLTEIEILSILVSFCTPIVLVLNLNSFFNKTKTIRFLKKTIRRFNKNLEIFQKLLDGERQINTQLGGSFILGPPDAEFFITIGTNLFCHPCKSFHKVTKNLVEKYQGQIGIQYVFSIPSDSTEQLEVIKYFGAIYDQKGPILAEKALDYWFENKDFNSLKEYIPINPVTFVSDHFVETHRCINSLFDINRTPMVFINGKLYPKFYRLNEIPYWISQMQQY